MLAPRLSSDSASKGIKRVEGNQEGQEPISTIQHQTAPDLLDPPNGDHEGSRPVGAGLPRPEQAGDYLRAVDGKPRFPGATPMSLLLALGAVVAILGGMVWIVTASLGRSDGDDRH